MKLLSALFFLIESLLRIIYEAIFGGDARADYGVGYNAQFIDESELLSASHTGFCINGEKSLSRETS
ncbi:MAG: hypothetical protein IPK03_03435 [Bacteroidetes bacterium]|nr:hypothetical protein [Bacteroidota bacterium]